MSILRASVLLAALLAVSAASGHEFWIEPTASDGGRLTADIRRGQDFRGNALVYNPANFTRFDIVRPDGDEVVPVVARLGDRPALDAPADGEGGRIAVYVSRTERTTYTALEQFEKFVAAEDLGDAVARHKARGLPEDVFSEAYTRYAKALVRRPDEGPIDRRVGLPIEIVLTALDARTASVEVLLFGEPMADAQLAVFARPSADDAAPTRAARLRTDGMGRADVAFEPGERVLLSAVHLRQPAEDLATSRKVVWETLWASHVFVAPR